MQYKQLKNGVYKSRMIDDGEWEWMSQEIRDLSKKLDNVEIPTEELIYQIYKNSGELIGMIHHKYPNIDYNMDVYANYLKRCYYNTNIELEE